MEILIAKRNEGILRGIKKDLKFKENTANTSTFNCSEKTFQKICAEVKFLGYNPYALMTFND